MNETKKRFTTYIASLILIVIILLLGWYAFYKPSLVSIGNSGLIFPVITISSLVDSINPCAFSVLLLTIGFLLSLGKTRGDILKIGGAYIFGIFIVYIAIGLGLLQTLHILGTPHIVARIGAILLIVFGALELIEHFFPAFPIKLHIPKGAHKGIATLMSRASIPTAFLLGGLVGLSEFPCTGGPYLFVLGLLHDHATFWKGAGYLAWYNLVFVAPLIVILLFASKESFLEKIQLWKKEKTGSMRIYAGVIMIVLGVIILFFQ